MRFIVYHQNDRTTVLREHNDGSATVIFDSKRDDKNVFAINVEPQIELHTGTMLEEKFVKQFIEKDSE